MISITCVIPIYNVQNYILDCLNSIVSQNFGGEVECLLIDDCGSDQSIEIASNFIKKYNGPINFEIIKHDCNKGLSAARNTGIRHASGEYIYFLDSDDKMAANCLELLTKPLLYQDYDVIVGGFDVEPKQQYHTCLNLPDNTILRDKDIIKQYGSFNIYMMAWNKLCKRKFLFDNECFFLEGILHEDELWSFQLSASARTMYIVNQPTYIYNIRGGSIMTSSKVKKRIFDMITVCKEAVRIAKEHNLLYNSFANRSIQNLLSKPIRLCTNRHDASQIYSSLLRNVGLKKYHVLLADLFNIRYHLLDLHWLLPSNIGFYIYCKFNRIKFS